MLEYIKKLLENTLESIEKISNTMHPDSVKYVNDTIQKTFSRKINNNFNKFKRITSNLDCALLISDLDS